MQLSATVSFTPIHTSHVEGCPDLGPVCNAGPVQPYQHDQHLYFTELDGTVELGLIPHLAFAATVGVRQAVSRIDYLDLAGNPYTPPNPDYHHRNETLTGAVDPWLMLHAGGALAGFTADARAGFTLPLGSTVQDPFRLGDLGLPHEHIQFGTGTFDPVAGLSVSREFGKVMGTLWTLDRFVVDTNQYGYRAGHRILVGAKAASALGLRAFRFDGGLDLFRETPETWSGVKHEEGNVGRTDLLLDVGGSWLFSHAAHADLRLQVPLHTAAEGAQVSYPAIISLGIGADVEP